MVVPVSLQGDAVCAEDIVDGSLVMALTWIEVLDYQCTREAVSAAGEFARAGPEDCDCPWRHLSAAEFVAGGRVDDWDRVIENDARADNCSRSYAGAVGDHRPASNERVVFDDDRSGHGWFQDTADADTAGDVNVFADLGTGSDGGPSVDHGVGVNVGADVDIAGHQHHPGAR